MPIETELAGVGERNSDTRDFRVTNIYEAGILTLGNILRGSYGQELQEEAVKLLRKASATETPKLFERLLNVRAQR